jgi:hypothetical protein
VQGYGLDDRGSESQQGLEIFLFTNEVQPDSSPLYNRGSFSGVKWPGREANHSPPSNAEMKEMRGAITPLCNKSS